MKITLIITMVSTLLLFSSCTGKKVDAKSEYYYYSWNKKKIYFQHIHTRGGFFPIPTGEISKIELDADVKTFTVLDDVIAKDKNHVFCWAVKDEVADAPTFCQISSHLFKDKNHVFFFGKKLNVIEGADPETYMLYIDCVEPGASAYYLNESGLAKDKNGYFFNYNRIDVDTATFKVLSKFAYGAFDKNFVYAISGSIRKFAIHGKLTQINENLLYDDYQVFHFTRHKDLDTILIKDKKSFAVYDSVKNTIFKVNGKLYWNNYEITNQLDINSFEYPGGDYAKDAQSVYLVANTQKNNLINILASDPATFKVIEENLAYDQWNVYYGGRIIPDADPQTIRKTENGLKDKNYEWRWNREKGEWKKVPSR